MSALPSPCRARSIVLAPCLLLAGLAAGCVPPEDKFPPVCPMLSLAPNAGQLTRFAGAGRDASDLVLRARITAVPAKCADGDDRGHVRATLHVEAELTRGIAARGEAPRPGYFVAVTEAGRVLQKQDFVLPAKFPANGDYANVIGDDIELVLPVAKGSNAAVYHIYVGFQMSPEELAYNRAHPAP